MRAPDTRWLPALESAGALFAQLENLAGEGNGFTHSMLLECRNDAAFLLRRLSNLALAYGCPPQAVERTRQMHGAGDSELTLSEDNAGAGATR